MTQQLHNVQGYGYGKEDALSMIEVVDYTQLKIVFILACILYVKIEIYLNHLKLTHFLARNLFINLRLSSFDIYPHVPMDQ